MIIKNTNANDIEEKEKNFFGEIKDEEVLQEFPKKFDIDYRIYETTVRELISWNNDGDIDLNTEYQRGVVWAKKRNSRFIESILLKLPIPGIIIVKIGDNKFEVLDGKQRLTALFSFTSLKDPSESLFHQLDSKIPIYGGKTFKTLSENEKKILLRTKIPVTQIDFLNKKKNNRQAIYATFERVNTGGLTLSSQNIRNALYKSEFLEKTTREANKIFADIPRFTPKARAWGYDVEFLLRIISTFILYKNKMKFPSSRKQQINDFAEIFVDDPIEDLKKNIFLEFKEKKEIGGWYTFLEKLINYIIILKPLLIESKKWLTLPISFWESFFICLIDLSMENYTQDEIENIFNNVSMEKVEKVKDVWNKKSQILKRIEKMHAWIKNSNKL